MNIISIADQIYRELETPSDISIPFIAFWLRSNIGQLNTLLNLSLSIGNDGELTPVLSEAEKDIFKKLFSHYYYGKLAKSHLGANAMEFQEVVEGDTRIKLALKTDKAKIYQSLQKDIKDQLDKLVTSYKYHSAIPSVAETSELYGETYDE